MTHTERAVDLLLFLQRYPRTFLDICARYPTTSERTLWRHLAELREVAGLYQDAAGRYTIPVRMFVTQETRAGAAATTLRGRLEGDVQRGADRRSRVNR